MKKIVSVFTLIIVMAVSFLALVGCGSRNELVQFERELNKTDKTLANIDNIASVDLAIGLFSNMSDFEQNNPVRNNLSNELSSITLNSWIGKLNEAKLLQLQLRDKQAIVDQNKLMLQQARADLKINIEIFRNKKIDLTEEEKEQIIAYISELKEVSTDIKGTIGKVYLKIFELRGKFNIKNLDNIIATYNDVQPYMDIRVEKSYRIIEIIREVNNIITQKVY